MARVSIAGSSRNGGRIVGVRVHDDSADPTINGVASGSLAIAGIATGAVVPPAIAGIAAGDLLITGQADGTADAAGVISGGASGDLVISGSAAGTAVAPEVTGGASGGVTIGGVGAGEVFSEVHVFALIGQSNSVGRADYDGLGDYAAGILQWNMSSQLVQAVSPLDHHDEIAGDMGLQITFANAYKAANPNAVLVLAPLSKGGSGFNSGDWNPPSDFYYTQAVTRLNALFAANPAFRLKGFLWHQGENDASNPVNYADQLKALVTALRANVTAADATTPLIVAGLTSAAGYDRSTIDAILMATPDNIPYSAAVVGNNLSFFDTTTHYNSASLRTLGNRYFAKLPDAILNTPKPPVKVAGVSVVAGNGQNALSWAKPYSHGAITDYVLEVDSGSGWTIIADGFGTGLAYTHMGLTNGTTYNYRISAVSALGTGAPSDSASGTPADGPPKFVAIAAFDSGVNATDATSYTFSGKVVAPGTVIVATFGRGTTAANGSPSGVTFAGSAMTKIGEQVKEDLDGTGDEINTKVTFWRIANASATTATIVVTHGATMGRCGMAVWSLSDADAASIAMFGEADINGNTLSVTIDGPARGALLAYAITQGVATTGGLSAGVDLPARVPQTLIETGFTHSIGDRLFASATPGHTVTSTWDVAVSGIILAGITVGPAA